MAREDEFYVGYAAKSPPGIARRTRGGVLAVFVVGLALAALFAAGQARFDPGIFEFGIVKPFTGVVVERPYPLLVAAREGGGFESHLLVDFGKSGAKSVAGLDGQVVQLDGQRIFNDERQMLEIKPGSVREVADDVVPTALRDWIAQPESPLGQMRFVGEIVDSKCHLGVMKPGRQKPHKACAIRCISGGVPPVLRVEGADGNLTYLLLVSAAGKPVNDQVLDLVAEPVEIAGRVVRHGDQLVLYADPDTYRRL